MIGKLLLIIAIAGGIYYGYQYQAAQDPEVIKAPIFAEMRMDFTIAGRDLNMVLIGKSVDREDCEQRGELVWRDSLKSRKDCSFKSTSCKAELPQRYQKLFNNQPARTTYLTAERGSKYERDGRMIIWGLNAKETRLVCDQMKVHLKKNYKGKVSCVT